MFDALIDFLHGAEKRITARIEIAIATRFKRLEKTMSAQSDAFAAALDGLTTRVREKIAEMDAQVAAIRASNNAQNDAALMDATNKLTALTASLGDHVDAMHQTAAAAMGNTAGILDVPAPVVTDAIVETAADKGKPASK